ncbi:MAG: phosphoribosylanthranilate isomerase [Acidobacteria bacterium]|nr:phosphoribosylanthranilate isomerase [Acidobacteriota bacterium]
MFVKICGITRVSDAQVAAACGASAIGFIFWPKGKRWVEPDVARAIARSLPPFVTPVGVFVDETVERMNEIATFVGLGAIQLHGAEQPDIVDRLVRPVVKAVGRIDASRIGEWPARVTMLVDAPDPVNHGGTGARADWAGAARLAAVRRTILAGGIRPENVVEAVTTVRPFGIDVASGVEDAPGIKNPDRIRDLFDALRAVPRSDDSREARELRAR